jgi:DNA-binding transcriptional LysR family regulator
MRLSGPSGKCKSGMIIMHAVHLSAVDLNLAPVLHALLAERSVSRAAKRLGLSQSATSHALARLRDVLGDPLLVRSKDGLVPTPRALALEEPVERAVRSLEGTFLARPSFDPGTARRRFVIATSDYVEIILLPGLISRLAEDAPGVDLLVRSVEGGADDELRRGEIDLVLTVHQDGAEGGALRGVRLFDDDFVCMMRAGHPLAEGALDVARFASARHALIAPGGRPGGPVDRALAELGLARRVALSVPHFLLAQHVIARTDLVLTIARRIAETFAGLLPLAVVESPLALPGFTIGMRWGERNDADPGHAWLRQRLVEAARGLRRSPPPDERPPPPKRRPGVRGSSAPGTRGASR